MSLAEAEAAESEATLKEAKATLEAMGEAGAEAEMIIGATVARARRAEAKVR